MQRWYKNTKGQVHSRVNDINVLAGATIYVDLLQLVESLNYFVLMCRYCFLVQLRNSL